MAREITWGILSTAQIGVTGFLPAARVTEGAVVRAVASRKLETAQAFAKDQKIPVALQGYQALLDDPAIDAIYNSLPNTLHAEWTIKAAQAGKHVFCEKPLAVTAAEGQSMIDACAQAGVLLFEAFIFRPHPQSQRLKQVLASGEIGTIRHIDAGLSFTLTNRDNNIRMNKDLGGGSIYDAGVYPITFSRFVAGCDPVSVQAVMSYDQETGVDMRTALILEYPDELTATIHAGFDGQSGPYARITGENGYITLPQPYHPRPETHFDVIVGQESRTETVNTGVPIFQPAVTFFQQCILGERSPDYMADQGIGTLKVVEAAFESAETGRKVLL